MPPNNNQHPQGDQPGHADRGCRSGRRPCCSGAPRRRPPSPRRPPGRSPAPARFPECAPADRRARGNGPRGRRSWRSGRSIQANQPATMPANEPPVYCIRAVGRRVAAIPGQRRGAGRSAAHLAPQRTTAATTSSGQRQRAPRPAWPAAPAARPPPTPDARPPAAAGRPPARTATGASPIATQTAGQHQHRAAHPPAAFVGVRRRPGCAARRGRSSPPTLTKRRQRQRPGHAPA